jgi:hypothetical protein
MSPYVVTVKRPDHLQGALRAEREVVSRCAVDTLEEAHDAAREACLGVPGSVNAIVQAVRNVFALPEAGGTVALPDGTVIEVEVA